MQTNSKFRENKVFKIKNKILLYLIIFMFVAAVDISDLPILKLLYVPLVYYIYILIVKVYFLNKKNFVSDGNKKALLIAYILIFYALLVLMTSGANETYGYLNIYGNLYGAPSLLLPIFTLFGYDENTFKRINNLLIPCALIGVFLNTVSELLKDYSYILLKIDFLSATYFIFPNRNFYIFRKKIVIYIASIYTIVFVGLINVSRATVLRMGLLFFIPYMLRFSKSLYGFIVLIFLITPIINTVYIFNNEISGFNEIQKYIQSNYVGSSDYSVLNKEDTRTHLYNEVIAELKSSDGFLFGNGAGARYFCLKCVETNVDTDYRFTVEVGFLHQLLKGGLLYVFLYVLLNLTSIFLLAFKSNNLYSKGLSVFLLANLFVYFSENLYLFNVLNILIFYSITISFSKKFRMLNDNDIKMVLK